jgi:DNA primase
MIPDEVVEQVREAADIVQIIGEHVALKKTGTDYRGPCPFHQGTHRNFSVSPRKKIYYCFVCHEGGDVFQFLQKRLGIDWPSAVRSVAEKAGIEVREVSARRQGPDPREPIWEINASAASYFQRVLWEEESAAPARAYLDEREISRSVADEFGIGFAPREIGLLRAYLSSLGFGDERLLEAGLLVRPDDDSEPRPPFRGRLTFPIHDAAGHPVGFGARVIGSGQPKYLNSAESPVFSKGKLLYALNWARNEIRRDDRVFVVEGYFDVVRLMAAGIRTVVAPMGTALTEQQAALLRRYTANVFLLYDSDKPGLKATFRSGDELLRQKAIVRVMTLPAGEDPDSFVRKNGAAAFNAEVVNSVDLLDRKIQILERGGWLAELQKKRVALDGLLPTLRAAADPLLRDLYLSRVAEVFGLDRSVLQREIGVEGLDARQPEATRAPSSPPRHGMESARAVQVRSGRERRRPVPFASAERELIRVMLHHPARIEAIAERIGAESFQDPRHRQIFSVLLLDGGVNIDSLVAKLDESATRVVQSLLAEPEALVNVDLTVEGGLASLRVREIVAQQEALRKSMTVAREDEKREILRRIDELEEEKPVPGRTRYRGSSKKSH